MGKIRLWTSEGKTGFFWNLWFNKTSSLPRTREVLLPKFKLEKNYNLVEALKSMGVTALFDKDSNMTGISDHRITIDLVCSPLVHPPHFSPASAPSKASLLPHLTSHISSAESTRH